MKNNLESYGNYEKYLDEETKKKYIEELDQAVEWIYGEGELAQPNEYVVRLNKFKEIGEPVKIRHYYYSELDVYYNQWE